MNPTAQLVEPEIRELIAERRLGELRSALGGLDPADVADLLGELGVDDAVVAFRFLTREMAGEVFAHLETDRQEELIEALGASGALRVVEAMDPDDRAELLDELPTPVAQRLIASLSPATRRITQAILGYPEDTVGRLMTPEYVRILPHWTIDQAIAHIRVHGRDAEIVHWVYITDDEGRLIDDVHIRTILLAQPDKPVASIMDNRFIALNATDDREEAVYQMAHYDRTALPVVDSKGVLLGIVTVDDVADVAEEEVTEDIHKMGGLEALDEPYMQTGFGQMLKKRGGWLAGLFFVQMLTIAVLGMFQKHLAQAAVLVLFLPLIIASGGNSGTQAASLLIRAIALQEVEPKEWLAVLRKEILTGLCLGAVLGLLGFGAAVFWHALGVAHTDGFSPALLGIAVGVAMLSVVVWAVFLGSMFPLLLHRMGFDPATISSPLVATLMDVSGVAIYLGVAWAILSGELP